MSISYMSSLQIFDQDSVFLQIYVLFCLKETKLYVATAGMACSRQLMGTYLLKTTTDDNLL